MDMPRGPSGEYNRQNMADSLHRPDGQKNDKSSTKKIDDIIKSVTSIEMAGDRTKHY